MQSLNIISDFVLYNKFIDFQDTIFFITTYTIIIYLIIVMYINV